MRRAFTDLASLAARLGVGGIFFANGWHKLQFGLNATGEQFAKMGASAPEMWAATTMLIELIGGALLVAGLAVPACGLILFAEALAVFVLVSGDTGLPLTGGDVNLIVALGAASVLLAVVGAGRLSVDHLVVIRRRETEAADEMAADAEADDVIASWRETTRASTPQKGATPTDAASKGTSAKDSGAPSGPSSPVTFPEQRADDDASDVTAPRKTARPRRPGKPASTTTETPRDTTSGNQDRLVAGTRKTTTPDTD